VVDRKKGKKGEKKRFNLLPPGKGEIGGLTFFSFFFNCGIKRQCPKDHQAVQNLHTTFWQRSEKKGKVVTTGTTALPFFLPFLGCIAKGLSTASIVST
jgi:hypothetical protein